MSALFNKVCCAIDFVAYMCCESKVKSKEGNRK